MKAKCFKKTVVIVLILGLIFSASPVFAQDMGKKLGRGLMNALTGWVEIPKNIYEESCKSNMLVGLTWGILKGAGYTVIRTVTGAYEIVTFPFAIPTGYEPIMQPEFVFTKEDQATTTPQAKTEPVKEEAKKVEAEAPSTVK